MDNQDCKDCRGISEAVRMKTNACMYDCLYPTFCCIPIILCLLLNLRKQVTYRVNKMTCTLSTVRIVKEGQPPYL